MNLIDSKREIPLKIYVAMCIISIEDNPKIYEHWKSILKDCAAIFACVSLVAPLHVPVELKGRDDIPLLLGRKK